MKFLHIRKQASQAAAATLSKPLRVFPGQRPAAKTAPVVNPLLGKTVTFSVDGVTCVGVVSKQVSADVFALRLAIPDKRGVLIVTDSEVVHEKAGLEIVGNSAREECKVRAFDDSFNFEIDKKMVTVLNEAKHIVDYRDVTVEGLASTFAKRTPSDRDGDYVMEGAFKDTLVEFNRNPVMLADHINRIPNLIGSYSKIGTTPEGLVVRGELSNAPGVQDVRFKVAEGHLRAFSIGGLFFYAPDGRGIEKVNLYEVSMTPVPANQDALFHVRSLTASDVAKAWSKESKSLRTWIF